ncbi:MAG: glycosyltransferase [Deltaproteobacteria bacterium]|nr:glycosyltransferase [Deltaproteobacteria bacterium]MBW2361433.1 glycosyltransferase [Deltaproteobacteria bacterium]
MVHAELVAQLVKLGDDYEILYLLASSAPREATEQAQALQEAAPERVRVIQFAQAVDRAGMLSAGVEHSRGAILFTVPDHLQIDLAVLDDLHAAIQAGSDLAFASRKRGKTGSSARIQSELFNRVVSLASGRNFRDIASETRALRRQVAEETPIYGDFYRYLPLMAERLGFRVDEIPARQHPRATSRAVHAPRIYLWRAIDILSIFFISRFTRHPLRLFGGVGTAFAASGGLVLLAVAIQRFAGTPLADRPVLVLGTLLIGLGVQTFTIGLLAELLLFFHARKVRDYRVTAVYEASSPPLEP